MLNRIIPGALFGASLISSLANASEWIYSERVDEFTDEKRGMVYSTKGNTALSCLDGDLRILLIHKYLVGDRDNTVQVQIRVDQGEAYGPSNWEMASGHQSSVAPESDTSTLLEKIAAGDSLLVRIIDPYDSESVQWQVSLDGFADEIAKLSCY